MFSTVEEYKLRVTTRLEQSAPYADGSGKHAALGTYCRHRNSYCQTCLLLLTSLGCMLFQTVKEALWQIRPVRLGVEVVLNVVAIVKCDGIVSTGHAIICDGIGTARTFWIDEDVLTPAQEETLVLNQKELMGLALEVKENEGKINTS